MEKMKGKTEVLLSDLSNLFILTKSGYPNSESLTPQSNIVVFVPKFFNRFLS